LSEKEREVIKVTKLIHEAAL